MRGVRKSGSGYTTTFEPVQDGASRHSARGKVTPAVTPQQLEAQFGVRFDSMVVDCEGCFEQFVASFPELIGRLEVVIQYSSRLCSAHLRAGVHGRMPAAVRNQAGHFRRFRGKPGRGSAPHAAPAERGGRRRWHHRHGVCSARLDEARRGAW